MPDPALAEDPAPRSALRVIVGVLYLLATLVASAAVLFMAVFAVSPTICPEEGGSYLCTTSYGGLLTLLAVGVCLLVFVGLAVAVPVVRSGRRAGLLFGGSLGAGLLALIVVAAAGSSWS